MSGEVPHTKIPGERPSLTDYELTVLKGLFASERYHENLTRFLTPDEVKEFIDEKETRDELINRACRRETRRIRSRSDWMSPIGKIGVLVLLIMIEGACVFLLLCVLFLFLLWVAPLVPPASKWLAKDSEVATNLDVIAFAAFLVVWTVLAYETTLEMYPRLRDRWRS